MTIDRLYNIITYVMGKQFEIIKIVNLDEENRIAWIKESGNETARTRILVLSPVRRNEASGSELNIYTEVKKGMGYLLKGSRSLLDWRAGDIISEELYPESLD